MTRPADPFTSTNARVLAAPEAHAEAALQHEGQLARNALGNLFGDRGEVQFRQYYGEEGRCVSAIAMNLDSMSVGAAPPPWLRCKMLAAIDSPMIPVFHEPRITSHELRR
jgi:hypothetical protein